MTIWKYHEDSILDEIRDYVERTYSSHYAGEDNVQAIDLISAVGRLEGFAVGNIIKYGSRYGRKDGKNRDDLMKVIHYAMFALWELDRETDSTSATTPDEVIEFTYTMNKTSDK